MKFLIVPNPDTTSLNIIIRCMSIAAEARSQGHDVCVLAPHTLISRFTHVGVEVRDYPLVPFIDRVNLELPPIKKYGDYATLIGLNDPAFIQASLKAEFDAIDQFEPDVIYSDLSLTTSIAARVRKKPLASLCNLSWTPPYLLDDSFEKDEAQVEPFNQVLASYSLPKISDLTELIFMFSDLKIVPTCPEFEQFHPTISGVEYVGHLYSEALEAAYEPQRPQGDERNILVYMGIGDIDLELMQQVFPATFDGTRYRVRVVLGDFYREMPSSTANVTYYRFLPLRQVLAETDLAIFHGGSGLVMTCLLYGVPGLMFPCGVYEREFHAETMARINAGIVLYEREQFNVNELARNVEIILQGNYRANAQRFGNYLRSLGGPHRAVKLLGRLASSETQYISSEAQALRRSA